MSISATPTTIAESATLNAGQCQWPMWKSAKSNTAPHRARSITLPIAPPMTRPIPQPVSTRSVRRSHTNSPTQTATATADRTQGGSAPSPPRSPKLTPRVPHHHQPEEAVDHRHDGAGLRQVAQQELLGRLVGDQGDDDEDHRLAVDRSHEALPAMIIMPSPPLRSAGRAAGAAPTCRPLPVPASSVRICCHAPAAARRRHPPRRAG